MDRATGRARIPEDVVRKLVGFCGRQWSVYGRDTSKRAAFGEGQRNHNSIAGEAMWLQELGGPRRYARMDDVEAACVVGDALDGINIVGAMADPAEVPVGVRCVEVMARMLELTDKPILFWFHDRASARFIVDMVIALRGSDAEAKRLPITYPLLEPISPLRLPYDGIDLLFETARIDMPVAVGPMAQMGLTAPCSLAATMALEHAEILAGICAVQLISPGAGICYGGICHAFDMRTTQMIFSGPEQAIFGVAMCQLGKSLGLPVYVNTGLTDSKLVDAQAGMEAAATLALSSAAGADVYGHFGISGVDQAASLDMLVFHDECIRYVESAMREVDFSDEAFALDLIDELGPGGSFIATEHTASRFRDELWFPKLLDRDYYQGWMDTGATDMASRCRERRVEILRTHRPEPMADDVREGTGEVVEAARRELAG